MSPLVECHSGFEYAERPVAFWEEGVRHEVSRIVREWNDPAGKHFLVEDNEGCVYQLDHQEELSDWRIQISSRPLKP